MSNAKSKDVTYYIHIVITLFFMFIFPRLNPMWGLTEQGMNVIGVFIGLIWSWTTIGFLWPSMLGMFALVANGYSNFTNLFMQGFGGQVPLIMLFLMIYTGYLSNIGVTDKMAYFLLSRKFIQGRPALLFFMIFFAAFVISMFVSYMVVTLLLWNICYSIFNILGFKKGDRLVTWLIAGIVMCAGLGLSVFPFKGVPLVLLGAVQTVSGGSMVLGFTDFTIVNLIVFTAIFVAYWAIGYFTIKADAVKFAELDKDYFTKLNSEPFTTEQKVGLASIVFFLIIVFAPSFLPTTWPIISFLNKMSVLGCGVVMLIVLSMIKIDGKNVLDFKQSAQAISWDIYVMTACTMVLGSAISSADAGVVAWMGKLLGPIVSGLSPTVFIVAALVIPAIITQVTHNLVLAALLPPIFYPIAIALGADPYVLFICLNVVLNIAFATPAGSVQSAMFFSNEYCSTKYTYMYAIMAAVIGIVLTVCLGVPLGNLIH